MTCVPRTDLGLGRVVDPRSVEAHSTTRGKTMELGAFSVSLAVEDMAASRDFYAKLGFEMIAGDGEMWTILANGGTLSACSKECSSRTS